MIDAIESTTSIFATDDARRSLSGRSLLLRRRYAAPIEEVWSAITEPHRLERWFLEVGGDLRPGGWYRLKDNARGEILRWEPPRLLTVTWEFGFHPASRVEIRLSGATTLELRHVVRGDADDLAGAGVGWDLVLLALDVYLRGADPVDHESQLFAAHSSRAWGATLEAAGTPPAEAARAVRRVNRFYAPDVT
ncbi:SRPBCC family protein [Spirillospora sp. NPDC047279]|uniref:SRPBCC family protein n=1 Tax=Spirillospora sp. NPDC047279 TaxID=3155478 RepID=UPI0033D5D2F1